MKFIADIHVHTVASGHAYNTIYEYAQKASELGLKYLGMTDHGPKMPGASHLYHFQNLHSLPKFINGVRIVKGVEANILDENGTLDIPDDTLPDMEVVIASFHRYLGYEGDDIRKNTDSMIKVTQNPYVKILGHPGNPQFPLDIDAVVEACKKNKVLIEINNSSFTGVVRLGSYPRCVEFAKKAKEIGCKVIFGSDAHCIDHLISYDKAIELAKESGLTEDDIVNTSEAMIEEHVLGTK